MSFFQRLSRVFASKATPQRQTVVQSLGNPVITPARYDKIAEEGYGKNVIAYAAINYVAISAAAVQWGLFSRRRGKLAEIEQHELLDLLNKPNTMQGRYSFMEAVVGFLKISGNSYIRAIRPTENARPTELWTLRPDRMKVIPGAYGLPGAFVYRAGSKETVFSVNPLTGKCDILHLKTWNPTNDYYGISAAEPGGISIDTHNDSSRFNLSLLQNQARPSGFFIVEQNDKNPMGVLKDDQFSRLKEELQDQYGGTDNAGRFGLLEAGLKWQAVGLTPQDMEWIEGKHVSAREIALGFGVPPILLNIPGDSTYSNYQEARLAFYQETILPLLEKLKWDFNQWLTPMFGTDLELAYDRDSIEALEPLRQRKWDKAQNADFLTINEKRQSVGYEEVDGGDTVLVGSGMVPLEFAIQDPTESAPVDEKPAKGDDEIPETKILNLPNQRARSREWRDTVRLRSAFERKLANQMAVLFRSERGKVLAALRKGEDGAEGRMADAVEAGKDRMTQALSSHMLAIGKTFGKRVLNAVKSHTGPEETKDADSTFEVALLDWIKRVSFQKIDEISETTLKKLKAALADGIENGESIPEIAERVTDLYDDFSGSRSVTIARTETLSASNAASEEAARASGIPGLKKEWIAAEDERTRESHSKADGETVSIDDDFHLRSADGTVHTLSRPGDPKGPPEEIINCRCTIAFVKEGSNG